MLDPNQILAASQGETEWPKVIIGVLFFLFWVVSSIASAISKKKEQEKRVRARQAIENPGIALPPPLPGTAGRAPIQRTTQRSQAMRQPLKLQKQPAPQRRFASKAPRPLPPKPTRTFATAPVATTTPTQAPLTATEIAATPNVPRRTTAPATATAIRAWLRPMTLKQQFMLTEVLQPPIALREPRDFQV